MGKSHLARRLFVELLRVSIVDFFHPNLRPFLAFRRVKHTKPEAHPECVEESSADGRHIQTACFVPTPGNMYAYFRPKSGVNCAILFLYVFPGVGTQGRGGFRTSHRRLCPFLHHSERAPQRPVREVQQ